MRRISLPDGRQIVASNSTEVDVLYHQVVIERTYERHGITIRPGDVVFDIGANVGIFSMHLARSVPGVHLHAFEPIPPVFEALTQNLAEHAPGARTYNVALADHDGDAAFEFDPFFTMGASMDKKAVDQSAARNAPLSAWASAIIADLHRVRPTAMTTSFGAMLRHPAGRPPAMIALALVAIALLIRRRVYLKEYRCRLQTLPAAMREAGVDRIDFVKLDVEGAEEAVLAGIDDRTWSRIRQIAIEVHDVDGRAERLRHLLERQGFRTTSVREDWALLDLMGIYNIYATRA